MKKILVSIIILSAFSAFNVVHAQRIDESCEIIATSIKDGQYKEFTIDGAGYLSYLWTDGIISAAGMPFDRLMEEFEKYYNIKIVIRRDTLPEIGYGRLRIRISDGISKAMELLGKTTDFNWIYDTAANVIYID